MSIELLDEKEKWLKRKNESFENPWNNFDHKSKAFDKDEPADHNKYWDTTKEEFLKSVRRYSKLIFNASDKIDELLLKNFRQNFPPFNSGWREYSIGFKDWDESYRLNFGDVVFEFFGGTSEKTIARKAHRKAVRDGLENNFTFWSEKINQVITTEINTKIDEHEKLISDTNKAIELSNNEINIALNAIERTCKEIIDTQTELDSLEKSKKEDLSAFSDLYPKLRKQELLKACKLATTLAKSARTPTESMQFLAFTYQIIQLSKTISN